MAVLQSQGIELQLSKVDQKKRNQNQNRTGYRRSEMGRTEADEEAATFINIIFIA